MPLSVQQQLHMPPWSMLHRFCTMLAAILSSHEQVSLKPPVHFSTLKVQRGTIMVEGMAGGPPTWGPAIPGIPTPGIPIPVRSIIIVLDMRRTPFGGPTVQPCGFLRGPPQSHPGSPSVGLSPVAGRL